MIINYLTKDITSYNNKSTYGFKGEKVIIIANHHPAILVTSLETGNSFSVHFENLSLTKIEKYETKIDVRNGKKK